MGLCLFARWFPLGLYLDTKYKFFYRLVGSTAIRQGEKHRRFHQAEKHWRKAMAAEAHAEAIATGTGSVQQRAVFANAVDAHAYGLCRMYTPNQSNLLICHGLATMLQV